jgi:hypothetical protein
MWWGPQIYRGTHSTILLLCVLFTFASPIINSNICHICKIMKTRPEYETFETSCIDLQGAPVIHQPQSLAFPARRRRTGEAFRLRRPVSRSVLAAGNKSNHGNMVEGCIASVWASSWCTSKLETKFLISSIQYPDDLEVLYNRIVRYTSAGPRCVQMCCSDAL